jgi:hypothetical protein
MNETSGVLRPVIEAYLHDRLTEAQIPTMRAYLRQWINGSWFRGPPIAELRSRIDHLTTKDAVDAWIESAIDAGCDPL